MIFCSCENGWNGTFGQIVRCNPSTRIRIPLCSILFSAKGAKDEVKRPKVPLARNRGPEGPRLLVYYKI